MAAQPGQPPQPPPWPNSGVGARLGRPGRYVALCGRSDHAMQPDGVVTDDGYWVVPSDEAFARRRLTAAAISTRKRSSSVAPPPTALAVRSGHCNRGHLNHAPYCGLRTQKVRQRNIRAISNGMTAGRYCIKPVSIAYVKSPLTATMLAYNLMSLFRQSIMRTAVQPTMATLRHQVFVAPAWCGNENGPRADQYTVAMPRQRRAWFSGLWSAALDPPRIPDLARNTF